MAAGVAFDAAPGAGFETGAAFGSVPFFAGSDFGALCGADFPATGLVAADLAAGDFVAGADFGAGGALDTGADFVAGEAFGAGEVLAAGAAFVAGATFGAGAAFAAGFAGATFGFAAFVLTAADPDLAGALALAAGRAARDFIGAAVFGRAG